jgi:predicted metal-dependent hydrolase
VTPEFRSGNSTNYTIERRPRVKRRLHLELAPDGGLLVVAPPHWPEPEVHRLVALNWRRVENFMTRAKLKQLNPLVYEHGARHLFRGEECSLSVQQTPGRKVRVHLLNDGIWIQLPSPSPDLIKKALQRWYRHQAEQLLKGRLEQLFQRCPWVHGSCPELKLRRMKRTWGTCNRQGVIRLNTHLVKAPPLTADYVIAHELCHLKEMNHSASFYELLGSIYPDWKAHKKHLKDYGHRYTQE